MKRMINTVRSVVLQAAFALLYDRLAFLHEWTGRTVFGAAWHGRRLALQQFAGDGPLLDIGCGEGLLLLHAAPGRDLGIGVDRSPAMTRRAARRGASVIRGTAQFLPLNSSAISTVVATYPGPWIADPGTWRELARVSRPGAQIAVLVGGTITRGPWSAPRNLLTRLAYGTASGNAVAGDLPHLGNTEITGEYVIQEDDWGIVVLWVGQRGE